MRQLRVSDLALNDLGEILEYVHNDRPMAAERLIERFWREFDLLCVLPHAGHSRGDVTDDRYRFKRVKSFVICSWKEMICGLFECCTGRAIFEIFSLSSPAPFRYSGTSSSPNSHIRRDSVEHVTNENPHFGLCPGSLSDGVRKGDSVVFARSAGDSAA